MSGDISVLDYHLDDVPDMTIADAGEVNLTFTNAVMEPWDPEERKKDNPDPNAKHRIVFTFQFTELEDVWPIRHYVRLPHSSEPDETKKRLRRLKDVYQAIGAPTSGEVNLEEYYTNHFFASISAEPETDKWSAKNSIRRFMSGQSG